MAITDTQIDNAIPEYGDTTPHPTQPNQALMNQLLKMVRDEVAAALTADNLQQDVGISTTTAMSQKAVTDELQTKLTAGDLVQVTGQSETDVMSQKAVTDQLLGVGQTWQNMLASRTLGVTYTNTTGRTIIVTVVGRSISQGEAASLHFAVDGLRVDFSQVTSDTTPINAYPNVSSAVPSGSTYSVSQGAFHSEVFTWAELR